MAHFGPLTIDEPAVVTNSDYKWLSASLKTAQLGPAYTPYFKLKIVDDSIVPNSILSNPNVPVLGQAANAPDGAIFMAGGDGSNNLKVWKLTDASQAVPAGTTLVASGSGYVPTLNTSIAISDWINGSYVIDIAWWATSGGHNIIQNARSVDGGKTWTINPYVTSVPTFNSQNFYIAVGKPVYNPANFITNLTIFYIRGNIGASSAYYKINYIQWTGGSSFGAETYWSRVADSQDWTLHSMDVQYLNGVYYIFFSGFHNWYETPSGNNNYSIYLAEADTLMSNAATDEWKPTREVFISTSPQTTNNNAFTFPRISTDGSMYFLIFNAVVGEGLQNSGSGANQIGTISNSYYYMMQSANLTSFSYPVPIYFTDGTVYADTAGVTLVPQNQYYYLLGNGQNWQYVKNSITADISDFVINYKINEVAGASSQISIVLGNANNVWIGSSPTGVGASAIAINKKILLEQGYVTSAGNEVVPRNVFYIDTITLDTTAPNNTASITGRDINRNLQIVSTKFSYSRIGPSFYNDLFDGTTLQNWVQRSGIWSEVSGMLKVAAPDASFEDVILQSQLDNSQESSMIFTMCTPSTTTGDVVSVYPLFQDDNNYFKVAVVGTGSALQLQLTLVINGSTVSGFPLAYSLAFTSGRFPILIRKYNYHTFDIIIGTGNGAGTYSDDALDPSGSFTPFVTIPNISLDSYFTSLAFLVSGGIALGLRSGSNQGLFQPFKFIQFASSFSLQEALEYLCTIAGITSFKESVVFSDNKYSQANYFGSYSKKNGLMLIDNPNQVVYNTVDPISNGQIDFVAKVIQQSNSSGFGFTFTFRNSGSVGSPSCYEFKIAQTTGGLVYATLYISVSGTLYQLVSTSIDGVTNSLPIDITQLHSYRVAMIDQVLYLFIDGQVQLMWQDTNFTTNSLDFSNGFWGMMALSNSALMIGNFTSFALYNQISNVNFNPGDDMSSILNNILEMAYAFSYTDQFGRLVGIVLNQTDLPDYTYQDLLYEIQAQIATQNTINEVVVTGNGIIATFKDTVLIGLMGGVRSMNVTDYTIITYQDALYRAQQELINANRLDTQNNPYHPMNVGSEMFDVIIIINTGNNSASINGSFRIYNQSFANNGSKGQYAIQIETGTL